MENTPEAPAAPAESVATPNTNENTSQAPAMPDMHGFTSEELAENPIVKEKYLGRNFVFRRKHFD